MDNYRYFDYCSFYALILAVCIALMQPALAAISRSACRSRNAWAASARNAPDSLWLVRTEGAGTASSPARLECSLRLYISRKHSRNLAGVAALLSSEPKMRCAPISNRHTPFSNQSSIVSHITVVNSSLIGWSTLYKADVSYHSTLWFGA